VLSEAPPYYYARIAGEMAWQTNEPTVLIVHSGAGALVPTIANAANGWIRGVVFIDALLPHPGKCWFDTAPKEVAARLRKLEAGGYLPSWNRWWPEAMLKTMLPDAAMRAAFIADLPALPLRYVEERAPDISPPEKFPCAYLQLSSGYDAEAGKARSIGWPTRRLALHHLATLTHPNEIADELEALISEL
jgi:hypothetical protein